MDVNFTVFFGAFLLLINGVLGGDSKGRGFGEDIDWLSFDDGRKVAERTGKPLMLVIHKSWCGACKALKPKFAASKEILELSSKFVMVNVEDDEEPQGADFMPDGGYIPRILFLNPDGVVQKDLINKNGNPKYKYFYSNAALVVQAMKNALAALGPSVNDEL
ncbi:thioredoxin domain-containing protein 12-like [Diadema setosum]|uniref:thioredoxin domain-containing protein 12-like n=1 Tax=Diadema setosum TaxID=31175 RepID=UPI003B3AF166